MGYEVPRSLSCNLQILANINAAFAGAIAAIPKRYSNVQSVYIKTAESAALPVYQSSGALTTE